MITSGSQLRRRILLYWLLVPLVAHAEIYKCTDDIGHVTYIRSPKPGCELLSLSDDSSFNKPRVEKREANPNNNANPGVERRNRKSELSDTYGSGFILYKKNMVVTNAHVVQQCNGIRVRFQDRVKEGTLHASNKDIDIALIKTTLTGGQSVRLRRFDLRTGESVLVAGFPLAGLLSAELNVTSGIVNATSGLRGDKTRIQISAPVQPGNSGGPVFDDAGNVAGVVVGKLDAVKVAAYTGDIPQNVNFAIKSSMLLNFLNRNKIFPDLAPLQDKLSTVQLAEIAMNATVQVHCIKR
jgi:S1-C subfamily serine protease